MYARVTNFQCDPARIDEVESRFGDIKAQVARMTGVVSIHSVWRADGAGVVMSIYESQAVAEAAMPAVKEIWGGLADLMQGPPRAEGYDHVEKISA